MLYRSALPEDVADLGGGAVRESLPRADRVLEPDGGALAAAREPFTWPVQVSAVAAAALRWGAEEARRWSGTLQRLDTDPAATGRMALVRRVPRGPVLGIAPFNFPLNLVAHKVAPAVAAARPSCSSRPRPRR